MSADEPLKMDFTVLGIAVGFWFLRGIYDACVDSGAQSILGSAPVNAPDSEPTLRGPAAGQRVFGRYVLTRILGRGGMGVVWAARDETLGGEVALKFLPDAVRWDPAAFEDLKVETRRARQLTHPNIVRIHDFVEDTGAAAISMELVDGRTLTELRVERPNRVFAPADIAPWLAQLASALDYAHAQARVVHRDLKPSNLMLTSAGVLKVADFGVARSLADSVTRVSMMSAGTLVYMSPQQAMGEEPAPADDVYAIGATLYELLTGKPPFHTGDVRMQLFQRVPDSVAGRRRALGLPAAQISEPWEKTIAACLAKNPADRPASAGEVAARLTAPVLAPQEPAPNRVRTFQRRFGAALLVLGAITVGLAGFWWKQTRARPADPLPEPAAATTPGRNAPAPPTPTAEFAEDFASGLAGWVEWGEPRPRRLDGFQGRAPVLDNNGDGMHYSGLTSVAALAAPQGFALESEVFLSITNPAGCHASALVGRTFEPGRWVDALGTSGDNGRGISLGLDFIGDACWNEPPALSRHLIAQANYLDEDGVSRSLLSELGPERATADAWINRWAKLRVEVDAARHAKFYVGDQVVWAPSRLVHPNVLKAQRLTAFGQSAGSAGKAYHCFIRLRATEGSMLTPDAAAGAEAAARRGDRLVLAFREENWRVEPVPENLANWFRTHGAGRGLVLNTPAKGGEWALTSQRMFAPSAAVLAFDVRPWLQSGMAHADTLRAGLVEESKAGAAGQRRFVGFEFANGEIWLVDTAQRGEGPERVRRLGTYAPGVWEQYNLRRTADGRVEVVGGRVNAFAYAPSPALKRTWQIHLSATDTTDGAELGEVRIDATTQ
jgi:hypothetical protein